MKLCQIYKDKVHYIFESETIPELPPYIDGSPVMIRDITTKTEVKEGWDYNSITGEFTEPIIATPEPPEQESSTTEQLQMQKLIDIELAQIEESLVVEQELSTLKAERQTIAQKQYDLELMMLEISIGGTV